MLDSQADLPECRVQTTFRPEGGSTMITVLFAAGCVRERTADEPEERRGR